MRDIRGTTPFARPRPQLSELNDALLGDEPGLRVVEKVVERDDVLTPYPNGDFTYRRCELLKTGLRLPDDLTAEEWADLGQTLMRLEGSLAWLLGDWLAAGERRYGVTYEAIAEQTGYEAQTLRVWKMVAERVDLLIRVNKLSWAHHRLVVALAPTDQRAALQNALQHGWNVKQFGTWLRTGTPEAAAGVPVDALDQLLALATTQATRALKNSDAGRRMQVAAALHALADRIAQGG